MKFFKITSLIILTIFANLLFAEDPIQTLKNRDSEIKEIISGKDSLDSKQTEQLKSIVNKVYDFEELSKVALGKHWEEISSEEKIDFINTFKELISNQSVKKLSIYKADEIEYDEPEYDNEKVIVYTIAYYKDSSTDICYKMHKSDGNWKVYDTIIDEASTALKYRDSFYKKIEKSSFQELLSKLKENLKKSDKS
ncbi:MAG: ABC transporter substrate-binding protein [Calditrichaeota bacterium]|nr:MAG: ABC transporter substrate-binding protein [Calditrichota bacterium]